MEASVAYLTMLCCYVYYVDDSKKQNNSDTQHIQTYTYEYDELGQLTEECSRPEQKCTAYAYDLNGNITTKTEYPVDITVKEYIFKNVNPSRTYTYSYNNDLWKDELTSYTRVIHDTSGDRTYTTPANTYDAIGNPTKYFGSDLEWDYGRRLRRFYSGLYDTTYSYNADGMLIKQDVTYNTIPDYPINYSYENFYDGTTLIRRTGQGFDAWFDYDESGSPVGMNVTTTTGRSSNPTVTTAQYYFIKNLQGDIVAMADSTGAIKCSYTYNSWGNFSVVGPNGTPSLTDHTNPANINPFRYRGYYYDAENQLYWLQSRFYDPSTGRFLNADSLLDKNSLFGSNLFVYCANNSVCYNDPTGMWCPEANARHEYHDLNYGYINKDQYDLYISVQNQLPCKKGKTVYYGQPRICTDGSDGNKIPDSNWQPYTALSEWGSKTITVLDAYQMPYVVMPGAGSANLGDKAVLINWDTGQCINCIVGEVGSSENGWGEVSIAALWSTGYPNHMTANNASGITGNYEIILYSGVSYDYDWSWGYTKINR